MHIYICVCLTSDIDLKYIHGRALFQYYQISQEQDYLLVSTFRWFDVILS